MAIRKVLMTKYGIDVDYWKITRIEIVDSTKEIYANVTLSGYRNRESSNTTEPMGEYKFSWKGNDYPYSGALSNLKKVAYDKIKQSIISVDDNGVSFETNPFSNSEDV